MSCKIALRVAVVLTALLTLSVPGQAEDTGAVEVVAEYRRPWEKATPAAETSRFRIKVV